MKIQISMLFVFLCFTTILLSQETVLYTKQQVYTNHKIFTQNGIPINQYDFENPTINSKLLEALKWSEKKDLNFALGVGTAVVGTGCLVAGLTSEDFSKGPLIGLGTILYAFSIPNFLSAGTKSRKAKKSFAELRELLVQ